ncbi:MAG: TusE/DsrC/DsvC family sulfur relay protein [Nitrospirae bacterium]|nr:TusE/DsrC/DsvC family sulfur relay protein [Nitrospirota bacterium]MCL5977152.1 TusE/DsrC/DsvC family sulfur relay protein [Nitrospirota bacterium]
MAVIEYAGGKVNIDDSGYLVNIDDWNEQVACALAEREGVDELTKERMDILKFIREYYKKYNFFPILNAVCKNVHQPKNCINEKFMDPLTAWKLAGLPQPGEDIINIVKYGQTPT